MKIAWNIQLADFYAAHRGGLFICALAITRCADAAEDAIHTAFARLLHGEPAAQNLKAYIFRAVRNAAIDCVRLRKPNDASAFESLFDPNPNAAHQLLNAEEAHHLQAAVNTLRGDESETIMQHIYGELTFREISELRGVPLGTVTTWYRRGLERLRATLQREES